jgi:hypothetical protein
MAAEAKLPGSHVPDPSPEDGRVGIFPNWAWVYGTVVIYGVVMILFLLILTRFWDFGAAP